MQVFFLKIINYINVLHHEQYIRRPRGVYSSTSIFTLIYDHRFV